MAGSCGPLDLSSCCPASVWGLVVTRNAFSELCYFLGPRLDCVALPAFSFEDHSDGQLFYPV